MFRKSAELIMIVVALTAGSVLAQTVTNASFESTDVGPVSGNTLEGWVFEVEASVATPPEFEIVDDVVQHGSRALRIVLNDVGENAGDIRVVAEQISVAPGETYRYSIWARTANPGSRIDVTVENNSQYEYAAIRPAILTAEWQELSIGFVVTDDATVIRSAVQLSFTASAGDTIYIDNLDLDSPRSVWNGPPFATGKSKYLGCAYSNAQAPDFENYWNQVTPENAGKWGSVEGARDAMNWNGMDTAYQFAKNNGFVFRYHVLVWGNQQPAWIESLPANEQLEEIEEWFQAVAERYPDINYLEVVNEPLHDPPNQPGNGGGNYISALGGSNDLYGTGWDWIIRAFELARQYFPDSTKLVINDYSIVNSDASTTNYLNIISLLLERDLIDAIGVQGHAFSTRGSPATMANNLDRLAETGLPIQVTELDIDGPTDEQQLADYQRIFPIFWEHPAVVGITLWGWRIGHWRTAQGAYLVDDRGADRPALAWLRDYVLSTTITNIEGQSAAVPQGFSLSNNYPNPFNPATRIAYSIPEDGFVSLKVYNMRGQEVATVFEGNRVTGNYVATFDGAGLASGVYLYRLRAKNFVETKKLTLLK